MQTFLRNKCQLINNVSAGESSITGVLVSIDCHTSTLRLPFGITGRDSVGCDELCSTAEMRSYQLEALAQRGGVRG